MAECWLGVYLPQLLLQYQAWQLQTISAETATFTSVYAGLPPLALYDAAFKQLHSVSPQAATMGVKPGMSQATAQALLPELRLLPWHKWILLHCNTGYASGIMISALGSGLHYYGLKR
ncbi:MAG: hypothetical protein LRY40_03495 [Shewanella fodinae]|nr:hypothetical protein [Shewanella fodinae]